MADFHKLLIKDIKRETPKAITLTFDVPSSLKDTFDFIPGQYITIKDIINEQEVRRAYSICSGSGSGILKVAIKEMPNGTFSVKANTTLKSGDTLEVHPPEGKFILQPNANASKTYCGFAAGSGITPIMGMIQSVMEQEPNSSFVLIYGNQSPEETIFKADLTELQSKYPNRLFIEHFYSRAQEDGAKFGRIEGATVNYVLKNAYKDLVFSDFFICGPEEMIDAVKTTLSENNVNPNAIHFELFTASTETNDTIEQMDGQTKVTVVVDDESFDFMMDQNKTLLDATLDEDIDAPYSCQGGVCSSCICRITEGKAIMNKNSILTDAEIEEGLILACQAHPTTTTLKVDFDDV